jgi:RNA polymerase-binding transcription factor DksA
MDQNIYEIYSELRKTKEELIQRLENKKCSPLVKPYIEGELKDIETALQKLEAGTFGTCEISGELIPEELLTVIPTLKSIDDCKTVSYFIRKESS